MGKQFDEGLNTTINYSTHDSFKKIDLETSDSKMRLSTIISKATIEKKYKVTGSIKACSAILVLVVELGLEKPTCLPLKVELEYLMK